MGADEPERELEDMEHRSEQLKDDISEVKSDWHAKQRDASVPGAEPREEDRDTGPSETQEEPGGPMG
jgi:hypothetical protein